MKYLFFFLLVLFVIWAVKRTVSAGRGKPPPASAATSPSEMITCTHCGIHLPQEEAVAGQKGPYCSTEHRAAAQDCNPS